MYIINILNRRVTGAPSSKTTYLVVGEDPGESKLSKARKHNITQINEDELLDLIGSSLKNDNDKKIVNDENNEHNNKSKSKTSNNKKNISEIIEIDEPENKYERALSSTINRKPNKSLIKKQIKNNDMEIDEKSNK